MNQSQFARVRAQKTTRIGMGFAFLILGVLISMMLTTPVAAKESPQEDSNPRNTSITSNVVKKVFDNGFTVLIKPNNDREMVSVNLLSRMGLLYESPDQRGISAFMQRMFFRGITGSQGLLQINDELEALGASRGVGSSSDFGYITLTVTKSNLDKALDIYLDVILNPLFAEREVERNKQEIIQQLTSFTDQPFNEVSLAFNKSFYGDHPYSALTLGNKETIAKLTKDDITAWYKKIYVPGNMIITIVGNVDPGAVINRLEDTFGNLPKKELPEVYPASIAKPENPIVTFQPKNIQGAFVILGYPAPSVLSDDAPAMNILNTILGADGMGSRLFTELRDKRGLVYFVGSSYQPMVGPTAIIVATVIAPGNYRIARDVIIAEFKKLIDQPVSTEELQVAQKYIEGAIIMSQETSAAQASILGLFELYGYGYLYMDQYSELVKQVTASDLQRVAKKYFNHYVLAVVAPEGSIEK